MTNGNLRSSYLCNTVTYGVRTPSRRAKSAVWSVKCLTRAMRLGLWSAIAALPLLGHTQEARSIQPPSAWTNPAVDAACSPSWPDRNSVPIKITDRLVLAIPMKYLRYEWLDCRKSQAEIESRRESLPLNAGAGFDFFLPDFSGFNMKRFQESFSPDEVHVAYVVSASEIEAAPTPPYPSKQLRNVLKLLADPKRYRDIYGLRCYDGRILKNTMYCYSANTEEGHKGILLFVAVPPYGPGVVNPQMWTDYFSKRYGGIEIYWRANVRNLPRWRAIDARIWKFLAAWNVVYMKKATP
jgi:hypothetical protein